MKRLTGSIALALVALVLLVAPASAGRQWCMQDPVVLLNGRAVQIFVAIPEEFVPAVNGPVSVRITVPGSVEREVIYLDEGFNGYGEDVRFQTTGAPVAADGSFDVRIQVHVPVSGRGLVGLDLPAGGVPVQVTVVTNGELTWEGSLPVVINGETTVAEGGNRLHVDVTVQGDN